MGPKFVLLLLHLHLFILGYLTCPNKALILHCNFWKINNHAVGNKRAVWNRRAGGIFFSKSINVQTEIRPCRGEFFLKINKFNTNHGWKGYLNLTKVFQIIPKVSQSIPKHCQTNPKAIPKYSKISQSIHMPITINVQDGIDVQGRFFFKIN